MARINHFSVAVASNANHTACYVAGTRLRTTRGDVAIDQLVIGDTLITSSGDHRPVRWLGHRTIDCTRHREPEGCWPLRIATDAFGAGRPARDIFVSPGHAVCIDVYGETLVPVYSLMNGASIAQVERDVVTYWHVELDSHDIVLAEGLPSESYCDIGDRSFFVESGVVGLDAGPDGNRKPENCCRPFVVQGELVDVVRDRLLARARALGWHLDASAKLGGMHLVVDGVSQSMESDGLVARFTVPVGAKDVWLMSDTCVPALLVENADLRIIGVPVKSIVIDDGLTPARHVALSDPSLQRGFHPVEEDGSHRWTMGRARLAPALWEGCLGSFFLRIELACLPPPRWAPPRAAIARAA